MSRTSTPAVREVRIGLPHLVIPVVGLLVLLGGLISSVVRLAG